jgi:hypothetical protein
MNAALEKGLNMVGLATTKTGSGEKERAYVVKQNSVLKGLLCVVILGLCFLVVVFSTILELKVARRGLIVSEAAHQKKEHHDHEDLIKTSLELQEALEGTIEETTLVDEFRAYFEKAVGTSDDMIDKLFQDANVSPKVVAKAKSYQREFVKNVEIRLGKILNRFHSRAAEAREKVVQLARMMGREIDHDARSTKKYEERLEELGVDEEYAEKLEEQYEEEEDEEDNDGDDDGEPHELTEEEKKLSAEELRAKRHQEAKERDQESEREVEEQLNAFFAKLAKLTLPDISPEKIAALEGPFQDMIQQLQDETKETDLDLVSKKMDSLIQQYAPGTLTEKYDPNQHDSMIDFYQSFLERAKLNPHKQTLFDLYTGWKTPGSKLTALHVLAAIENIASKENLMRIFDLLEGNDMDPSTDTRGEHEVEADEDKSDEGEGEKQQQEQATT